MADFFKECYSKECSFTKTRGWKDGHCNCKEWDRCKFYTPCKVYCIHKLPCGICEVTKEECKKCMEVEE